MRHHFAADFCEAAFPPDDANEAIGIDRDDVAGPIPSILDHPGRRIRLAQIPLHHIRSMYPEHPLLVDAKLQVCILIDHLDPDTGGWFADRSFARGESLIA